jgi:hypothetical protein
LGGLSFAPDEAHTIDVMLRLRAGDPTPPGSIFSWDIVELEEAGGGSAAIGGERYEFVVPEQRPMIGLGAGPGGLVLTWAAPGALQAADNVIGPWADVPGAVSPYTVQPVGARKFYRVIYR